MPARYQDFTITAGDDQTLEITVSDRSGSAQNLTGFSARWKAVDGTQAVIEKSTDGGVTVSDPANGVVLVQLTGADTKDLKGEYRHALEITDGSGRVSTVTIGSMTVEGDLVV